ncbi:hypothetical protein [Paenibacillus herberti]|uniref:Uncharacterized protein n=1 Tax=Paenibacillus herberti TaxID=1619309 RepID=A0A229P5U1_9BACL|nr:hypothetical protein [Paenibacillus herberti]OXM17219.1 hypothetical protein CGZ75_11600 [Paenibacillus herberti]
MNDEPCPKPPAQGCIIHFTQLQTNLFGQLLDDLTASIQPFYIPPAGPLPNVLKVLQNLFKTMTSLSLRDKADLFAATELPITAYEQSDGWSAALIAATQTTLTELYAFSLLACVSSSIKDDWVIQIRLAETNLAGVSGSTPPVISGTVLTLDGGNEQTFLSYDPVTLLSTDGAIPGIGFTSPGVPFTTSNMGLDVSVVLTGQQPEAFYYAFSMPQSAVITGMTAQFIPSDIQISGVFIAVRAQLCQADPDVSPYVPFDGIPDTLIRLRPALFGNTARITCEGSLNDLNVPIAAEERLVLVFTIVAETPFGPSPPNTIQGTLSATITIEPANPSDPQIDQIIPFASQTLVSLETMEGGTPSAGAVVGFGFSENSMFPPEGAPFVVSSELNSFTIPIPFGGTVTSIAAYFGLLSGQILTDSFTIFVSLNRYNPSNNTITRVNNLSFFLINIPAGTYTESSPGIHGLSNMFPIEINVNSGDQLVLLFSVSANTSGQAAIIEGWVSGGLSIGP